MLVLSRCPGESVVFDDGSGRAVIITVRNVSKVERRTHLGIYTPPGVTLTLGSNTGPQRPVISPAGWWDYSGWIKTELMMVLRTPRAWISLDTIHAGDHRHKARLRIDTEQFVQVLRDELGVLTIPEIFANRLILPGTGGVRVGDTTPALPVSKETA